MWFSIAAYKTICHGVNGSARVAAAFVLGLCLAGRAASMPVLSGDSDASIDLATREGVASARAAWRFHTVDIVEVDFRSVGPDRKPTGAPNRTYDYAPHAGAAAFDDSDWEALDPTMLAARRSTGKLCFAWYRTAVTVPERVGSFDPTGSTMTFEITVDDYAEVWVDGELPRDLGQAGGTVVAGFNVPNKVVVARNVKPGQTFQIAVFAMNGPISAVPENYIWVRSARLGFHSLPRAVQREVVGLDVLRLDPALDRLVPHGTKVEKVAEGFLFTEGPVWVAEQGLLFSDPNANRIYRWSADKGLEVLRDKSGYEGADVALYGQPGSNGLALDEVGRLTICEHGNRRVTRQESDGRLTVLAQAYQGKRLNSPNDLVYGPDGSLYFTDPPFGLPRFHDDPRRELTFTGVFRLPRRGELELLTKGLTGPNGVALSPDGRWLYVTNWDPKRKVVMRYEIAKSGGVDEGDVFFDMGQAPEEEALDGVKVDQAGNLYVSGPGGVWVLAADGRHLGTLRLAELPANFAFGDADGRTLYMTARTSLYRMRVGVAGYMPVSSWTNAAVR